MGKESPARRKSKNLWRARNQAKVTAATRRWRHKHKGAAAAHSKVQRDKAKGKGGGGKCANCGKTGDLKVHHHKNKYTKKAKTSKLCPACHAKTMKH